MVYKATGLNEVSSEIGVNRKKERPKDRDVGQCLVCEEMRIPLGNLKPRPVNQEENQDRSGSCTLNKACDERMKCSCVSNATGKRTE